MHKDREEWDERSVGDANAPAQQNYDRAIPDASVDWEDEGHRSVDILGVQMFAYCEVHNKRFPAGENCPGCP